MRNLMLALIGLGFLATYANACGSPPAPARPPITMDYKEAFENFQTDPAAGGLDAVPTNFDNSDYSFVDDPLDQTYTEPMLDEQGNQVYDEDGKPLDINGNVIDVPVVTEIDKQEGDNAQLDERKEFSATRGANDYKAILL